MTTIDAIAADDVVDVLRSHHFGYADERQLQDGLFTVLRQYFPSTRREVSLGPRDRVDFLVGGVAVEVKVSGSPVAVARQLQRYAHSEQVTATCLVTAKTSHTRLPDEIGGKPLVVVLLAGRL